MSVIDAKIKRICIMMVLGLAVVSGCGHNKTDQPKASESVPLQKHTEDTKQKSTGYSQKLKTVAVFDNYSEPEKLKAFFKHSDAIDKMMQFNQLLNNKFEFYEIYDQPLQSKFYWKMDDRLLEDIDGEPIKNQKMEIDGEKCYISSLNSIQVNFKAYGAFLNYIQEGRGFEKGDFQYKKGEKIPIILGHDYRSYYSVGDTIQLNYLAKDLEFEVIGFFKKGLRLKIEDGKYDMNKYVCTPFFDPVEETVDKSDQKFWQFYYQDKNAGYIKTENEDGLSEDQLVDAYNSLIEKDAKKIGVDYSVLGIEYDISSEISDGKK